MEHNTDMLNLGVVKIPNLCVVTGGEKSRGVVTVAGGRIDNVSGGIVGREEGDGCWGLVGCAGIDGRGGLDEVSMT